jgi:hypothetical protein
LLVPSPPFFFNPVEKQPKGGVFDDQRGGSLDYCCEGLQWWSCHFQVVIMTPTVKVTVFLAYPTSKHGHFDHSKNDQRGESWDYCCEGLQWSGHFQVMVRTPTVKVTVFLAWPTSKHGHFDRSKNDQRVPPWGCGGGGRWSGSQMIASDCTVNLTVLSLGCHVS